MMNEEPSLIPHPAFIIHHLAEHRLPLRVVGAEGLDGAVALVEGAVEVVRGALDLGGGGLEAVGARGPRGQPARLALELLDLLDEREVEAVDALQLRLLDLDGVEEAGVAVTREADAVLDLVELLQHAVYGADLEEPARRRQVAHQVGQGLFGQAQALGQVLAVQLVRVAAPLLGDVARVARNLVAQTFKPVSLVAHALPPEASVRMSSV